MISKVFIVNKIFKVIKIFGLLFIIITNHLLFANVLDGIDTNFNNIFDSNKSDAKLQENVPGFETSNPKETKVNSGNINDKMLQAKEHNEASQFIDNSFSHRTRYDINADKNLITNTEYIADNNNDIISNYGTSKNEIEYKICYNKNKETIIKTNKYNRICNITHNVQCAEYFTNLHDNLNISVQPVIGSYTYNDGIFRLTSLARSKIDMIVNIHIVNIEGVNLVLEGSGHMHNPQLVINGINRPLINGDITKYFKTGDNTMHIFEQHRCHNYKHISNFNFKFYLKDKICKKLVSFETNNCDYKKINPTECKLSKIYCIDNTNPRVFFGLEMHKSCWNFQKEYECIETQRYENDCASMDLKNCVLEKKQYLDDTKTVEQFTYKCVKGQLSTPDNSQLSTINYQLSTINSKQLSTINYQLSTISDNTAEFTHSVAMLMGAKELVNNFDTDNLQFLKGSNKKCSIKLMNFGNCCKGHSGFGQCNTEELQLLRNKKDGLCHYIGEYCCEREGATRMCIRKKQSYCCYPSKLARIINVSARQQLHLGFGTAEHPICDGLTQEQVQQVDFSQIDFSEIYSDVSKSITIDSNFNKNIENAINDFYKK